MESDYTKSIKALLNSLKSLEPLETGIEPAFEKMTVRAVIFDIYGTLLISDSGDINKATLDHKNLHKALYLSGIQILARDDEAVRHILEGILSMFKQAIIDMHSKIRTEDRPFPEVDIIAIWEDVLTRAKDYELIHAANGFDPRQVSTIFEILSNKVWPMPGMKETIQRIHKMRIPLGIVSNAQSYTPLIMNYFMGNAKLDSAKIPPFDPDLTVYSYKHLIAKPDPFLYEKLVPVLKNKYDIEPYEAIFVGNDMLNDIYAAHKAGLKTALYAADKRSLRLRKVHPEAKNLKPDITITSLDQIFEIISK